MASKIQELDSKVAKAEGKKKQVSVGDVREVRLKIQEILATDDDMLIAFLKGVAKFRKKK